jgi:hypothetical protein
MQSDEITDIRSLIAKIPNAYTLMACAMFYAKRKWPIYQSKEFFES